MNLIEVPQDHKLENGILFIDHVQVSSPDSKTIVFTHSSNGEITLKINEGKMFVNLKSGTPSEHQFMKEDYFGFLFHRFLLGMCKREIGLFSILNLFAKYLVAHRRYFKSWNSDIFVIDSKNQRFTATFDNYLYALKSKEVKSELFESFIEKCLCQFSFSLMQKFKIESNCDGNTNEQVRKHAIRLFLKVEELRTFPSFQFICLIEPGWVQGMDSLKDFFDQEIQEREERQKRLSDQETCGECL